MKHKDKFLLYCSLNTVDEDREPHYPVSIHDTLGGAVLERERRTASDFSRLNHHIGGLLDYRVVESGTAIIDAKTNLIVISYQVRRVPYFGKRKNMPRGSGLKVTGVYQTRDELEERVLYYYYVKKFSQGQIARRTRVTHRVISNILDEKGENYCAEKNISDY